MEKVKIKWGKEQRTLWAQLENKPVVVHFRRRGVERQLLTKNLVAEIPGGAWDYVWARRLQRRVDRPSLSPELVFTMKNHWWKRRMAAREETWNFGEAHGGAWDCVCARSLLLPVDRPSLISVLVFNLEEHWRKRRLVAGAACRMGCLPGKKKKLFGMWGCSGRY